MQCLPTIQCRSCRPTRAVCSVKTETRFAGGERGWVEEGGGVGRGGGGVGKERIARQ